MASPPPSPPPTPPRPVPKHRRSRSHSLTQSLAAPLQLLHRVFPTNRAERGHTLRRQDPFHPLHPSHSHSQHSLAPQISHVSQISQNSQHSHSSQRSNVSSASNGTTRTTRTARTGHVPAGRREHTPRRATVDSGSFGYAYPETVPAPAGQAGYLERGGGGGGTVRRPRRVTLDTVPQYPASPQYPADPDTAYVSYRTQPSQPTPPSKPHQPTQPSKPHQPAQPASSSKPNQPYRPLNPEDRLGRTGFNPRTGDLFSDVDETEDAEISARQERAGERRRKMGHWRMGPEGWSSQAYEDELYNNEADAKEEGVGQGGGKGRGKEKEEVKDGRLEAVELPADEVVRRVETGKLKPEKPKGGIRVEVPLIGHAVGHSRERAYSEPYGGERKKEMVQMAVPPIPPKVPMPPPIPPKIRNPASTPTPTNTTPPRPPSIPHATATTLPRSQAMPAPKKEVQFQDEKHTRAEKLDVKTLLEELKLKDDAKVREKERKVEDERENEKEREKHVVNVHHHHHHHHHYWLLEETRINMKSSRTPPTPARQPPMPASAVSGNRGNRLGTAGAVNRGSDKYTERPGTAGVPSQQWAMLGSIRERREPLKDAKDDVRERRKSMPVVGLGRSVPGKEVVREGARERRRRRHRNSFVWP